jgi:tetratricopeptide (TPR) repeat protein/TolB-like protein
VFEPLPEPTVTRPASRRRGRVATPLIATAVILVLTVVGFAVNRWMAGPTVVDDAVPVAVTCFEHRVDPGDPGHLGAIVSDLVINGLSESRYVRVISVPHSAEGHDLDADIRAATEARARWVLVGSIMQEKPRLVVTSRLQDTRDGTVMATQEVTAAEGENIFDVSARLAAEVKRDLVLPRGEGTEAGLPIARVTTRSVRAYRHYVEGIENLNKLYRAEARAELRKAVACDSTFAMAMIMLVHPEIAGGRAERDSLLAAARRHSAGLTLRERFYLETFEAWSAGDTDGAIAACERLVERYPQESEGYRMLGRYYYAQRDLVRSVSALETAVVVDPFDGMSLNRLAYMHAKVGDYDRAFRCVDRYLRLAPTEANPYDTRGDLLAWTGEPDAAVASYKAALERNPRFFPAMQNLGCVLTLMGRYDEAARYFRLMLGSEDAGARSRARWYLAMMEVYRGRLDRAETSLRQALAADALERVHGEPYLRKMYALASVQCARGDTDAAVTTCAAVMDTLRRREPGDIAEWPVSYVEMLSRVDIDAAKTVRDSIAVELAGLNVDYAHTYWACDGWIRLRDGDAAGAVESFQRAREKLDVFEIRYPLGLAYLAMGRADDAIRMFEDCAHHFSSGRLAYAVWSVKTYYHLACAYEAAGRIDDARGMYARFLSIWGGNWVGCDEVVDASERIAVLEQHP